jgi:formamidopyrimidine-DNA glycosylase
MPELPEVETIRRGLENNLVGKTFSNLEILSPKSFLDNPELVEGKKIISLSRIGKQISIHLSDNYLLLIHLKMTGQLIYFPLSSKGDKRGILYPNKYTRLIFTFTDKSHLYFNDLRKFGWIRLIKVEDLSDLQKNLGIDLLDDKFTLNYFSSVLKNSKKPIKTLLLDQLKFAGIGNIYASESLFLARIYPLKPANKISSINIKKLYRSVLKVIKDSLKHGGSTAKDKGYLQSSGESGSHQNYFQVYQREGESCFNCGGTVKRIKTAGRSTFFCSQCQK